MKKGLFSLILSLVMGFGYLVSYFMRYPFVLITGRFDILGFSLRLPKLNVPPYVILLVLGVFVNLAALIAYRSTLAMGAAVFYGVAVAFSPETWPCLIPECILCVIAAGRIREDGLRQEPGYDPNEPRRSRFVLQGDMDLSAVKADDSRTVMSLNGKPLNGKPLNQRSLGSGKTGQGAHVITVNGKPMNKGDRAATFLIVMGISIAIVVASFFLTSAKSGTRNGGQTTTQTTTQTASQTAAQIILQRAGTTRETSKTDLPTAPDLSGDWVSNDSGNTGMSARIEDGKIHVYWVNQDGTKNLYWAGTSGTLTAAGGGYAWLSIVDSREMKGEPFASSDTSKLFTYMNGTLSYQAKVGGKLEMTFKLHRVE